MLLEEVGRRRRAAPLQERGELDGLVSQRAAQRASSRRRDGRRLIYLREGRRRRLEFCTSVQDRRFCDGRRRR